MRDAVYGANDGIITTFSIVAGVVGADLGSHVILLLGVANLLADGFSMAASSYLGTKSEDELHIQERETEARELKELPEEEIQAMHALLAKRGYKGRDLERLIELLLKKKEFWLDIMLEEELGVATSNASQGRALASAGATFAAFVGAGVIPLAPYLFMSGSADTFQAAVIFTGVALFLVGALRSLVTRKNPLVAGSEMLVIGGIAAAIAYGVGSALQTLVNVFI